MNPLSLVFLGAALVGCVRAACPDGYETLGATGRCFRLTEARVQSVAVTLCDRPNEVLIGGANAALLQAAKKLFLHSGGPPGPAGPGGPGKFFWTDRQPLCKAAWSRSEDLVDAPCGNFYPAICELLQCRSDHGWIDRTAQGYSCYKHDITNRNYYQAKQYCEDNGVQLVEINSAGEQGVVGDIVSSSTKDKAWLGLDTIGSPHGQWISHISNSPPPYTCWGKGEPNDYGGNEDCVHIGFFGAATNVNSECNTGLAWNDISCMYNDGAAMCEGMPQLPFP